MATLISARPDGSRTAHAMRAAHGRRLAAVIALVAGIALLGLHGTARAQMMPSGAQAPATHPLTLADLEQMALAHNPTIPQAQADVRAAAGRKRQAGLYPNPVVSYEGQEISGAPTMHGGEHGVFIQQPIVTAGKLRLGRAVFAAEEAQAESVAAAQRQRVVTGVRLAYYQALGAQELLALRRHLARIANEAVVTSKQLFNVGEADKPDLLEATVEAQRADLAVEEADSGRDRVWRQLAAIVGEPSLPMAPLAGSLETGLPHVDRAAALQEILQNSPEMKAADQNVTRARLALSRARAERYPNVSVRAGFSYNREQIEGLTRPIGWVGMAEIGMQVPIFDRNQGNIAAATAELTHAERERDRVRLALTSAFADPYETYTSATDAARRYRTSILPQAAEAYTMYLQKYRAMAAAYPQVLIAQRTLFQLREQYVRALVGLWQAAAEIKGFLLTDGLAAPSPPGEAATVSPGVEVPMPRVP